MTALRNIELPKTGDYVDADVLRAVYDSPEANLLREKVGEACSTILTDMKSWGVSLLNDKSEFLKAERFFRQFDVTLSPAIRIRHDEGYDQGALVDGRVKGGIVFPIDVSTGLGRSQPGLEVNYRMRRGPAEVYSTSLRFSGGELEGHEGPVSLAHTRLKLLGIAAGAAAVRRWKI